MKRQLLLSTLIGALILALTGSAMSASRSSAAAKQLPTADRVHINSGTEAATEFSDNFDTYTAGTQLVVQNGTDWDTWTSSPGSGEDPFVSSTYSSSAPNSVKIVSSNDLIRLHGNPTSGVWSMTWDIYIPDGKAGYFNTMSEFTPGGGPPYYWTMEVYFDAGGAGRLLTENPDVPFTWTEDTWHSVEVIADLDRDQGSFLFDGTLIGTWVWTLGASGGTGPLQLADNDFYGATAGDEMYLDNYQIAATDPPDAIVEAKVVPESGDGAFELGFRVTNVSTNDIEADFWVELTSPGGVTKVVMLKEDVTLAVGKGFHHERDQELKDGSAAGPYRFVVKIGTYPNSVISSASTVYTKTDSASSATGRPGEQTTNLAVGIPCGFGLNQNYPNPFNPMTTISYELPVNSHVTLTISDVVGSEVARLVDGSQEAGYKSVTFDGSNLASGIYFYRLQAGNFVETRKLMLMR